MDDKSGYGMGGLRAARTRNGVRIGIKDEMLCGDGKNVPDGKDMPDADGGSACGLLQV
jgi:hypothetical protein